SERSVRPALLSLFRGRRSVHGRLAPRLARAFRSDARGAPHLSPREPRSLVAGGATPCGLLREVRGEVGRPAAAPGTRIGRGRGREPRRSQYPPRPLSTTPTVL